MAIWLSRPGRASHDSGESESDMHGGAAPTRFGVPSDIVPREVFGALVDIQAAHARARADRDALLAAAKEAAARIVAAARAEAQALLDAAAREREGASERGFEEGMAQGLAQWFGRLSAASDDAQQIQMRMRQRMAEIVMAAVEQIVRSEKSDALFARAIEVVNRIIEGATYLRVAVHPDDHPAAQQAFDMLAVRWRELGRPLSVQVIPDKRLDLGSCICESDLGIVDASMATQLRTMHSAVERALNDTVIEQQT